ncbi:HPr(Ser) kinase/phosphatase [Ferrovum sp.]|uniref:HPr(Ser) kinase/phosphatase n=1 Tax=Ferrovum sp. TaxID=2609467 RepID=UPI00261C30F8|nr:HPr(Ser) kinase/phosphatase [Ferrovum sp.]
MPSVSVQRLFTDNRERLDLCWLAGQQGSLRVVTVGALSDSTAGLIAHLNLTHPHRFQVLGAHEMAYLQGLDEEALAKAWEGIFSSELVAIFLSEGCVLLPALAEKAEQRSIPVMGASVDSTSVINQIRHYLSQELAEQESLHGVFMVILEVGVLITGDSGVGKSELALELISRGNGLVADDVVEFYRITPDTLQGRCPPLLRDFLEVRGLGLLNIRSIFGETAVRPRKNLKLIVHLERPSSGDLNTCERLPMGRQTQSILGVAVPRVVLPVAVGRNLAVLVEAATRNFILEQRGINSTQEFIDRQQQFMQESCIHEDSHEPQ